MSHKCIIGASAKKFIKDNTEGYPEAKQILLWIGSAIAIIVTTLWVVINDKVTTHDHDKYASQTDIQRVIDSQNIIEQRMDSLNAYMREQNRLILDIHKKWLAPPPH